MTRSVINKGIVFIFLLLCFGEFLYGDDKEIGLNYFRQAEILYYSGKIKEAEKLLRNSYEFYPDFSETTFLLSLILFKNQRTTLHGLSFLKEAIEDNAWIKTDPFIALRELGRVYLQTGLLTEALEIFQNMGVKLKEDMLSALLLAKTYIKFYTKETDTKKLDVFLSDSLERFPSYIEFYILYAEFLNKWGKREKARQIINQGLEKIPDNPDLTLAKIKLIDTSEQAAELLILYFEKGGQSLEACILALLLRLDNPDHYMDMYFDKGGNNDILYLDQMSLLIKEKEDLFIGFKEKESVFSGERVVDKNRDGFFEELYQYNNGNLLLWQQDNNQDGMTEVEIVFEENVPASVHLYISKDHTIYGKYSTYPYIESFTFKKKKDANEYLLLPLQYAFRLFRETKEEMKKQLAVLEDLIPPVEEHISRKAFRLCEYKDGYKTTISELLHGNYVSVSKDTDKDGKMDHILDYHNGVLNKGKRDLDGDNYFEIKEYFNNGNLMKITYNQNNDEHPDCIQMYDSSGEILETHWDYNSNGIIDAKEIVKNKGMVELFFSTGYDGVFDLYIIFRQGKVVNAKRGNKELVIIPGTKQGVYWIGKRGRNVDIKLFSGSGLYYIKGIMYFIIRYRDSIYIEELD